MQAIRSTDLTKVRSFLAAGKRKIFPILAATLLSTVSVNAQEFDRNPPSGKDSRVITIFTSGLAAETRAAARDLVTFRDREWSVLTIAQVAAATVDAETSLHNFHRCPVCTETGISRVVVGRRPDIHKYAIAGLVEIGVEAIVAHYLRNHGPIRKWYWQFVWALPQSISLYGHTRADFHNAGLNLRCDRAGLNCF
jgi:hypothetical protein